MAHQERQFLSDVRGPLREDHLAKAHAFAAEIMLLTPSLLGSTCFDRLFKALRGHPPEDIAAVALLRRGQPRIARLSAGRFEDLATGEKRPLLPTPIPGSNVSGIVFGRFAVTLDGFAVPTGMMTTLDDSAYALVQRFVQAGRGLTHPRRCAEALYRYLIRVSVPEPEELPFDPANNPLDALAADWALLDSDPGPNERARARAFVGPQPLLIAMIDSLIARDGGAKALAAAYRRIAMEIMSVMAVREAYGSARFGLDRAAAMVEDAIVHGQCDHQTRDLFNELREQVRHSTRTTASVAGSDLDKLMQRIRALREKTVEQGCTEQEALAAAEKVAELLDRYGLSVSELDLRKQSCEGIGVETGRKRRGPIDDCMGTIAAFFDCRVWAETGIDGTIRYIFFGLPGDVQAAVYLHDLIALAFANETATFQRGDFYGSLDTGPRRSATNSFHVGLAQGIIRKLDALGRARDAARAGSNGRALVPVKQSILDDEMERLGLSLRQVSAPRRKVISKAFTAGQKAGEKFDYRPGIETGNMTSAS